MIVAGSKGAHMRKLAMLLVVGAALLTASGTALADAPPPVAAHQHFLVLPDGTMLPVGPDICANPEAAQGFYGFHQNIHTGTPVGFAFVQPNNPIGFTRILGC
jgi:hypothetical protein